MVVSGVFVFRNALYSFVLYASIDILKLIDGDASKNFIRNWD